MSVLDLRDGEYREWLRARRKSLGGTAAGAILGVNKYLTVQQLWEELLELRPRTMDNANMERGRVMEPIIATIYQRETGRGVWPVPKLFDRERPYVHGTPDRFQWVAGQATHGVLEIKCHNAYVFQQAKNEGVDPGYYAQLQHYMGLAGVRWGSFALFNADGWELHWFDVQRDDVFLEGLRAQMDAFWHDHVLGRRPPAPAVPTATVTAAEQGHGAEYVERTDGPFLAAMDSLRRAVAAEKLAKHEKALAVEAVKALLGTPQKVRCRTGKVAWVETTTRSLDKERLVAEHPEVRLAEYERLTAGTSFTPYFPS
jgi:putative phage-type endonuclease